MNEKLFIDANFFCAFFNSRDSLSARSVLLSQNLNQYDAYTSNLVLYESLTILAMRASKQNALSPLNLLSRFDLNIIWHTQEIENQAIPIFADTHKDFSFIDSTILATIQSYNIKKILTFDKSFLKLQKKYRFKVIS